MSNWARTHPERMAEIARLPIEEQLPALRVEAMTLAPKFLCRGCIAERVKMHDDFCGNCLSEAMAEASEPSSEQMDAEYEAQKYDAMREQR